MDQRLNCYYCLQGNFEILQHRNQQERCNAARTLQQSGSVHSNSLLMVDTMENAANKAYGALPIRLVVIQNEKVQYAGGLGPTLYKTTDVKNWLSQYRKRLVNRKRAWKEFSRKRTIFHLKKIKHYTSCIFSWWDWVVRIIKQYPCIWKYYNDAFSQRSLTFLLCQGIIL